jgi:hypothetical protein
MKIKNRFFELEFSIRTTRSGDILKKIKIVKEHFEVETDPLELKGIVELFISNKLKSEKIKNVSIFTPNEGSEKLKIGDIMLSRIEAIIIRDILFQLQRKFWFFEI